MNIIKNNPLTIALFKSIGIVSAIVTVVYTVWYLIFKETETKIFSIIVLSALLLVSIVTLILLNIKLKESESKCVESDKNHKELYEQLKLELKEQYDKLNSEYIKVVKNRDNLSNVHESLHTDNERLDRENITLKMFWMKMLVDKTDLQSTDVKEISKIVIEGENLCE